MMHKQVTKTKVSSKLKQWLSQKADIRRRLAIAYEHYKRTSEDFPSWNFDKISLKEWAGEVPPSHVLNGLKLAKERECFEEFAIYTLDNDPILIGVVSDIQEWNNPFVIASWGNDVDSSWLEKNTS